MNKAVALDYGGTISAEYIDHVIGQKPVDPAAAAALRALHDRHGLRLILASNTMPCETRWPALQQAASVQPGTQAPLVLAAWLGSECGPLRRQP